MIYDGSNNTSVSNGSVGITLQQNGYCIICSSYNVASGKSGSDGHFKFDVKMDTSLLQNYHIVINVPLPNNYLQYPEPVGPGITNNPIAGATVETYNIDPVLLRNLSFTFYSKTLLHVNMHRTTAIVSSEPSLDLTFTLDNKYSSIWGFQQSLANKDTSLTINTSPNIFTRVLSQKFITDSGIASVTDSIKCVPNSNNSIDIYY